ncbi:DUF429 domain-containing protein [Halorubrum vacuolatum]|uniref:Predicted nuclease (RNAse H fold) n=1 Tax=Halorubrum vacuolatum TaxID=63740 RepID=A0A238VAB0_HALVU|nr:DUF429 domain-containing protein [Halorubrum vacuolatum]SNR30489.1 Predicted nuclease (RNAse H fold) [Halorubrum vacuolatum]
MPGRTVAGVDWAGGAWLVVMNEDDGIDCTVESNLESLWDANAGFDRILIDVPIGLPSDDDTLAKREELDSCARSVTGRPSSVFPVPSRDACTAAGDGEDYETVAERNRDDLDKGLSTQSYAIAGAIAEIDEFLRNNEGAEQRVMEAHPEVCFRGLLGEQLEHSKTSARGIGERLSALDGYLDEPGATLGRLCRQLDTETADVTVDDVVDALGLCVIAGRPEDDLMTLPETPSLDDEGLPMQMVYWSDESLI